MEVKKLYVLPMYTCSELHGHNLFFTSYFYDCKTTFLNLYNKIHSITTTTYIILYIHQM